MTIIKRKEQNNNSKWDKSRQKLLKAVGINEIRKILKNSNSELYHRKKVLKSNIAKEGQEIIFKRQQRE